MLAAALVGFFLLINLLGSLTTSGPDDLLAAAPSEKKEIGLPSGVGLFAFAVGAAGIVLAVVAVAGVITLSRRSGTALPRRYLVIGAIVAFLLACAGLYLAFSGVLTQDMAYGQHQAQRPYVEPKGLAVLGAFFLSLVLIGFFKPRLILAHLAAWLVLSLIFGFFGSSSLAGLNLFDETEASPEQEAYSAEVEKFRKPQSMLEEIAAKWDAKVSLENGNEALIRDSSLLLQPGTSALPCSGSIANPLFTVTGAEHTSRLRSATGDIYENGEWTQLDPVSLDTKNWSDIPREMLDMIDQGLVDASIGDGAPDPLLPPERVDPALLAQPSAVPESLNIDHLSVSPAEGLESLEPGILPVTDLPLSIKGEGSWNPFSRTLRSEETVEDYEWRSIAIEYPESALAGAEAVVDPTYYQLPDNLPQRVRDLASEITEGLDSPYEKAKAIEQHLKSEYSYSVTHPSQQPELPPEGRDPVDWFLFEQRSGGPTSFSSAFSVLARASDVPARVVSGWAISPKAEEQVVYGDQSHQWSEVGLQEFGWIPFDPTPGGAPERVASRHPEEIPDTGGGSSEQEPSELEQASQGSGMGEGSDEETPEFPEDIALQNLADALDPDVRKDAAEILGDIGSDRALEGLADAMFNDPDEAVKDAAIDSMASQDFDRLLDILQNDPEPIMRRAAAICLGRKGDPKALNPLGNSLVGQPDADEDVRAAAASALGELLQPEAVEPLSQALEQDDSPKVRKACAGGLATLGQGKGSGPLEQALAEDSEEDVRASAADALGELLSPDSLPALLEGRSNDPSPKVRGACSNAISRYTQSSLEQALESSSDPSVRASAAQVLGEQGNSSAADNLIDALQDPAEEVRQTAEEAVQNLGTVTPLENGGGLLSQGSGTSMIPGTTTGQAAELPHLPVFEVEGADGVDFLRTAVGARYEGGQWYPDQQAGLPYASESPVPDLGLLAQATASPAQTNTSLISVRPTGEEQWIPEGKVPISSQPSRLSVQGTLYPDSETFATDQRVASYNWTSNAPGYSQEQLRQASISPHYAHTTLPEGIPERVGELAQRITSGHSTPYQKAKAIEQYLKSNYTYRLADPSAGGVPQGQDPVDWFLFENREGTCGNFSSAFVVLARSVGLSARVVSGWSIVPEGGAQTVYTDQAHQRAEVAFEGLGWVPFEPTAGGGAPARAESGEEGSAVSQVERQEIENLIEQLSSDQPENQEQTRQDLEDTGAQFTETENGGVVCTKDGQALGLGVGTTTRQVEKPGSRGGDEISATTESSGDAGDRFPVFLVSGAAHTRYLRSAVGDVYEDGRWRQLDRASLDYDTRQSIPHLVRNEIAKAGPSTLLAAGGLAKSGLLVGYDVNPSVTYTDNIVIEASPRLGNLPAGVVPTSRFLDQVNSDGHFDPVSGTFSLDASTESFSYVSQIPQFSRAQLEAATVASNPAYTQLPSGLPERIRDLALEITQGHDSPYAKAKALESYLSTQYTYRFADGSGRENPPDGRDPVDWFLFDHLEGTCGVFSTAFVVMARSIGIPARVAAGWAIGPTGERQEVFTDQAHQWAEVAFEGLGWVQFEPTASLGAPSRAASVSEEAPQTQFQGGEDSQSPAAEAAAPETTTPVESETQQQPISEEEAPETTTPVESETQQQPISEEETPETATPEESETQEPPISEEERPEENSQPTLKHTQPATPTITVTSITSWPAEVRRKTAFAIGGTVRTDSNSSVSGMQVEIFINETKEHGGIKIGETTSQLGKFQTEVTLPSSMERGPFQLLAHAVGNEQYAESWSDPDITVYSESGIQLTGPEEVPVDTQALFRGKLMDDTGSGVANLELQVAVDGRDLPLQLTDEVGEFGFAQTFTEVGPHIIEVSLEGKDFLLGNSARLDVTAVMPAELSVAIPGEVRVAEGFPIEGLLLDARGNPITGAELTLTVGDGPPWSVATGDDGEFATTGSIESVGDSVIRAEFLGEYPALPAFHSATVTARHLTAMAFSGPSRVMQREEAVFQGRITSKSLPDIGSLEVLIEDRGGTLIDTVTTEMDGSFEYRSPGLADAGPRVLTARFQEQQRLTSSSASLSLAVVAPTVLTVEGPDLIRAGATADLSGVLRTEDGQPVPGVPVWVGDPESRPLITDANGAFGREFPVEAELSDSTVAATVNIPFGFDGTDRLAPSLRNHAVAVGVPWLSAEPTDAVDRGETATLRGSVLLGSRPLPDVVVSAEPGFRAVTNATGSFVLQYPVSTDTPLGRNEIAVSVVDLNLEAGVPVNVKSSVNLVVVPLEDVRPSREAILQATLYDDKGQGIPGAVLRTSQGQEAITNNAGRALLKLTVPDSEDMLAFPVTFNYEGDDLHTSLSYFAGIPITQSSFNWLLWAGLPALVVAVLVSGFAASRFGSLALPTGVWVRTRRRARGDEATATEGPVSEEQESPDVALEPVPDPDPTSLTVTLETPAPDLPAVWGLRERIPVHITLSLEDGPGIAGASLSAETPNGDHLSLETDESGSCGFSWDADREGEFMVSAQFQETILYLPSSGAVDLRVVDFREEIVRLYNEFVAWAEEQVPGRAAGRTPRELESVLTSAGLDLDYRAVDETISRFEEADYSEHPIGRRQYESMYRSWHILVGE